MQLFVEDIITAYETEHRVVLSSRLVDADDRRSPWRSRWW